LLTRLGDRWATAVFRNGLNWALQTSRPLPPEDDEYRDALTDAEALGAPHEIAMARGNLGRFHLYRGDTSAALPHLHEALDEVVRMRQKSGLAYMLDALAEAALQLGHHERAVRLLAAADKVRQATGAPAAPAPLERNRRNVELLRGELGAERFEQAWAAGNAHDVEQAVADARAVGAAYAP
jgi:tetratricopeptide (TPR) repeat protein